MKKTNFIIFTVLAFTNNLVAQQDPSKEILVMKHPSTKMHWEPGGPKMGDLYINTPVIVERTQGDWALIRLQTWVSKDALGKKEEVNKASPVAGNPSLAILSIEKFSLEPIKEGGRVKRVYLNLTLKNNSPNTIKSWRGLLVGQSESNVLFREQIADNTKTIEAGKTGDLRFFWQPNEEPFSHLVETPLEKLKLELYKVVLE